MNSDSAANGWGTAFLAIANTVDPAMRAEYEAWHTFEHVPERLTMPGFMAGRRFVQERGDGEHYLTLYDLEGPQALETPEYLHLLANPTPTSRQMRPHMGAFRRFAYGEVARFGTGCGRHLGILRCAAPSGNEAADLASLAELTGNSGIVSLRVGRLLETPPHPAFPADPASQPHRIALASGTDSAGLRATLHEIHGALGGVVLESGVYDLIVAY
jgi:hypothetical protein